MLWLMGVAVVVQMRGAGAARWLLAGGYTGVEGRAASPLTAVELLDLEGGWCGADLGAGAPGRDGAVMEMVAGSDWERAGLGDPQFTSAFPGTVQDAVLSCGGAGPGYRKVYNATLLRVDTYFQQF